MGRVKHIKRQRINLTVFMFICLLLWLPLKHFFSSIKKSRQWRGEPILSRLIKVSLNGDRVRVTILVMVLMITNFAKKGSIWISSKKTKKVCVQPKIRVTMLLSGRIARKNYSGKWLRSALDVQFWRYGNTTSLYAQKIIGQNVPHSKPSRKHASLALN